MAEYRYVAMDFAGKKHKGVLEAESEKLVIKKLKSKDWIPVEIVIQSGEKKQKETQSKLQQWLTIKSRISATDLMMLTRQLSTLISSGMQLDESFGLIASQSDKALIRRVATEIKSHMAEGLSLAQAMEQVSVRFPEDFLATVKAGEETGHMSLILERLADETEESAQSRQSLVSALIYPIIMVIVSILVVIAMMVYVVPQITDVFSSLDEDLPIITRYLILFSDFLLAYGRFLFILIVVSVITFSYRYQKNIQFRKKVHKRLTKIPLIGGLVVSSQVARWARSLALLLSSGVPTMQALNIAVNVVGNLHIREEITSVNTKVKEGYSLNHALKEASSIPSLVVHMVGSGEHSGNLAQMMQKITSYYEQYARMTTQTMLKLFEPMLILVMGGVVLVIVLAVLLPIFSLNQMV